MRKNRSFNVIFPGLLLLLLWACKAEKAVLTGNAYIYVKKEMPADTATLRQIEPYRQQMGRMLAEVIGYAPEPLVKGKPNAPLGNYIADLLLAFARERSDLPQADMAIFNNGGLRTSLPGDSVRVGDIFELMPFENTLLLVRMSGDSLLAIAPYLLARGGEPVSGVRLLAQNGAVTEFSINGRPVDPSATYYVLTSDYLAAGGDRMYFFGGLPQLPLNIKMRDAIIEAMRNEFKQGQHIRAQRDNRIEIKNTP